MIDFKNVSLNNEAIELIKAFNNTGQDQIDYNAKGFNNLLKVEREPK